MTDETQVLAKTAAAAPAKATRPAGDAYQSTGQPQAGVV